MRSTTPRIGSARSDRRRPAARTRASNRSSSRRPSTGTRVPLPSAARGRRDPARPASRAGACARAPRPAPPSAARRGVSTSSSSARARGRSAAVIAPPPSICHAIEERLEHLVDEDAALARRQAFLVVGLLLEAQHVAGEVLERALRVQLDARRRCASAARAAATVPWNAGVGRIRPRERAGRATSRLPRRARRRRRRARASASVAKIGVRSSARASGCRPAVADILEQRGWCRRASPLRAGTPTRWCAGGRAAAGRGIAARAAATRAAVGRPSERLQQHRRVEQVSPRHGRPLAIHQPDEMHILEGAEAGGGRVHQVHAGSPARGENVCASIQRRIVAARSSADHVRSPCARCASREAVEQGQERGARAQQALALGIRQVRHAAPCQQELPQRVEVHARGRVAEQRLRAPPRSSAAARAAGAARRRSAAARGSRRRRLAAPTRPRAPTAGRGRRRSSPRQARARAPGRRSADRGRRRPEPERSAVSAAAPPSPTGPHRS